jgi:hypothetical protein
MFPIFFCGRKDSDVGEDVYLVEDKFLPEHDNSHILFLLLSYPYSQKVRALSFLGQVACLPAALARGREKARHRTG